MRVPSRRAGRERRGRRATGAVPRAGGVGGDAFDGGWGFAVARVDADDATGGRLYAWGECARDHVLEEPPTTSSRARDRVLPARLVDAAADAREDPGPVAAGWAHVVFLVHGAGGDTGGDTARALGWRRSSRETPTPTPRDVHLPRRVRALTAGERHTLAVCEDGSAWAWGDDACGQLGATRRAATTSRRNRPRPPPPPNHPRPSPPPRASRSPGVFVVAACAGARHSVVVDARGAAYAFGWGLHGQLGLGDGEDARAPTRVASLDGVFIARAAAGTAHTVLLTHHGTAYAFGSNHHGQLGVPEETCPPGSATAEPVMVEIRGDPNDEVEFADVRSRRARREGVATPPDVFDGVSCGSRHTAAVSKDGTIRAWGWNARGQLGTGDRIDRSTPTAVEIPGGRRAARVACGWWHTLVEVVDEDEG